MAAWVTSFRAFGDYLPGTRAGVAMRFRDFEGEFSLMDEVRPVSAAGLDVLVADDDPSGDMLAWYLNKHAKMRADHVWSNVDALARIADGFLPQVLVLDQVGPGLDAFEALAKARRMGFDGPAVLSTGLLDMERWAQRAGFIGVLELPHKLDHVGAKLKQLRDGDVHWFVCRWG